MHSNYQEICNSIILDENQFDIIEQVSGRFQAEVNTPSAWFVKVKTNDKAYVRLCCESEDLIVDHSVNPFTVEN